MDGELVILDGEVTQLDCNGGCNTVGSAAKTPYISVCKWMPERATTLHIECRMGWHVRSLPLGAGPPGWGLGWGQGRGLGWQPAACRGLCVWAQAALSRGACLHVPAPPPPALPFAPFSRPGRISKSRCSTASPRQTSSTRSGWRASLLQCACARCASRTETSKPAHPLVCLPAALQRVRRAPAPVACTRLHQPHPHPSTSINLYRPLSEVTKDQARRQRCNQRHPSPLHGASCTAAARPGVRSHHACGPHPRCPAHTPHPTRAPILPPTLASTPTLLQVVFDLGGGPGTLVGFWSPEFEGFRLAVVGFHLHFVSSE